MHLTSDVRISSFATCTAYLCIDVMHSISNIEKKKEKKTLLQNTHLSDECERYDEKNAL